MLIFQKQKDALESNWSWAHAKLLWPLQGGPTPTHRRHYPNYTRAIFVPTCSTPAKDTIPTKEFTSTMHCCLPLPPPVSVADSFFQLSYHSWPSSVALLLVHTGDDVFSSRTLPVTCERNKFLISNACTLVYQKKTTWEKGQNNKKKQHYRKLRQKVNKLLEMKINISK